MKSLLSYVDETPTYPLKLSGDRLLSAAIQHEGDAGADVPELGDSVKENEVREKVFLTVNSLGKNLGPAQNARAEFSTYYEHAIKEGYNFGSPEVCEAFGYFLLAVATEGFEEKDTTGTQRGNYQGSWRGGGFT